MYISTHTRAHTSKDGSVCAGVHPRFSIEYVLTRLHVWMDARVFLWAHRGHRYRCACARGQMTRVSMGARESSAVHRSKYMSMCMYIHLYLDPCVWSGLVPRVWASACADARAGARARVASAVGCDRRSECIGVSITCMRACVRACAVTCCGFVDPSEPMSVHCAAARACCARQVHLLHEGEGAPRVARPVQAP